MVGSQSSAGGGPHDGEPDLEGGVGAGVEPGPEPGVEPGGVPLTAYVIMRPADGSSALGTAITSETIASLQPAPEALTAVRATLSTRGFTLGPFVGISFAITGPAPLFQEVFGSIGPRGDAPPELPLDRLDPELQAVVEAVVVEGEAELFDDDPGDAGSTPDGG